MTQPQNKLFVYGIFLSERMRKHYGMENPQYATVRDYATYGSDIVTAYKQEGAGLALTGLLVDVMPYVNTKKGVRSNWRSIDVLETGYDRKVVKTVQGDVAYMYVGKERSDQETTSNTGSGQTSQS